jgi:hypothetical protein
MVLLFTTATVTTTVQKASAGRRRSIGTINAEAGRRVLQRCCSRVSLRKIPPHDRWFSINRRRRRLPLQKPLSELLPYGAGDRPSRARRFKHLCTSYPTAAAKAGASQGSCSSRRSRSTRGGAATDRRAAPTTRCEMFKDIRCRRTFLLTIFCNSSDFGAGGEADSFRFAAAFRFGADFLKGASTNWSRHAVETVSIPVPIFTTTTSGGLPSRVIHSTDSRVLRVQGFSRYKALYLLRKTPRLPTNGAAGPTNGAETPD